LRANQLVGLLLFFGLISLIDWLLVENLSFLTERNWLLFALFPLTSISLFIAVLAPLALGANFQAKTNYKLFFSLFGFSILLFVPKFSLGLFIGFNKLINAFLLLFSLQPQYVFLYVGIAIAALLFIAIADGMIWGKHRFRVKTNVVSSEKLSDAFDGLKVVQLSDIHIGSFFNNHKAVKKGIDKLNALNPDLVLFTGDLVNNYAAETEGWETILSKIKAKHGVFAILGNHDYGDYVRFGSLEEKRKNREKLIHFFEKINWNLLLNENTRVYRKNEFIQIAGVENWGLPPFPQYGNLGKALAGINTGAFTLLLSHDPSHWDAEINEYPNIDLTLSGHTHGMQFSFEIGKLKWSPVKWKYPKWAGAYFRGKQQLYVNRGFGYIGFPGRVGIWPEITLHILKKP